MQAAAYGHISVVSMLLKAGVNVSEVRAAPLVRVNVKFKTAVYEESSATANSDCEFDFGGSYE